eukprot:scaffold42662_cov65-Phaeocystis_antarctica.AAC.1
MRTIRVRTISAAARSSPSAKSVILFFFSRSWYADAACRESRGGHIRCEARCGPEGGRRRATAAHAACRGGLDYRLGGAAPRLALLLLLGAEAADDAAEERAHDEVHKVEADHARGLGGAQHAIVEAHVQRDERRRVEAWLG